MEQPTRRGSVPSVDRFAPVLASGPLLQGKLSGAVPVCQPQSLSSPGRLTIQKKSNAVGPRAVFSQSAPPAIYRPSNSLPAFPGPQASKGSVQPQMAKPSAGTTQKMTRMAAPPIYRPSNNPAAFPGPGPQTFKGSVQR
jgi:hypothetical protein